MSEQTSDEPGQGIRVRPFEFDFPEQLDTVWVPGNPYRSHFFNGVSLTMPYLEPYLVKTMREAMELVDDEDLHADMRGFNGQEAQHYRCHRRLNVVLTNSGQPGFAEVERRIDRAYKRLSTRSLRTRMAYSAGFECMTNGFTNWMIGKRCTMFRDADPHITSFWLMHMVEETEHKTVAFDAYQACFGNYWPRAFGVLHGSFHVLGLGVVGMLEALKRDKALFSWKGFVGFSRHMAEMVWEVGPFLLRALKPNYNPRQETEADWVSQWIDSYAASPPSNPLPLIDTTDGEMRVPFAA